MKIFSNIRLYLLLSTILLSTAWFVQPNLNNNGLLKNKTQLERIAFFTSNDLDELNTPNTIRWSGYLFTEKPSEIYFRIPHQMDAKLTIADNIIFNTKATDNLTNDQAVFYSSSGVQSLTLEITPDVKSQIYFQGGLEWQTIFGWQIVPVTYLYPSPPEPNIAQQTILRSTIAQLLFALSIIVILIVTLINCLLNLKYLSANFPLLLIILFALTLRFIILPSLINDILPFGSDHRGYQVNALDFLRGTYPIGAFYIQPGMSLFMGMIYSIVGVNIRAIQIIQLISGGLSTLLIFDLARRTFETTTAYVAAILWAIFPLSIFYETQVLTHGLEPHIAILLLWLWHRTIETTNYNSHKWLIALGLTLGISAIIRPTFLIIAPFISLSLFWANRPNITRMTIMPLVLAIITLIPIAPITWHNYRTNGGNFQLLTSNNDITLYLGNNRDSTGLGEYSPAFLATHTLVRQGKTSYVGQTIEDIRADPMRWIQLMLRKVALYLSPSEYPNNVDFSHDGLERSPLLAFLLPFGFLMTLSLTGIVLTLKKNINWQTGLLLIYLFTQISVTVTYHVFSRFRAPIYSILPIFAAYTVTIIVHHIHQRKWYEVVQTTIVIAVCSIFFASMPYFAEWIMRKPVVTTLPTSAKVINAKINDSLTLVGYEPLPTVQPEDPFFITLYWQSQQSLPKDYFATVQFFAELNSAQKITQADQAIGSGSFPDYLTSQWQPKQIVWDRYFVEMPNAKVPLALTVLVAVYERATGQRLGETTFGYLPLTKSDPLSLPANAQTIEAQIGSAMLSAYTLSITPANLDLTLYWQAKGAMPDATIFIHIFDTQGNFLFGHDTRPLEGTYSTKVWQNGEGIVDKHTITLPVNLPQGKYTIKVGMYETTTQNRFPVLQKGNIIEERTVVLGEFTK